MADPDPDPDSPAESRPPDVRASDAERERVAEVIRHAVGDGRLTIVEGDERLAAAYGATHRGELVPVVADLGGLPASFPTVASSPAPSVSRPLPSGGRPATTTSIGVLSGADRSGDWVPGATHYAVAIMGGVELDLRHARLGAQGLVLSAIAIMGGVQVDLRGVDPGPDGVTVQVFAFMGGVEIRVDEHVRVENHGLGIMGGFDVGKPTSGAPDRAAPVVRVQGLAMMGGVQVARPRGTGDDRRGDAVGGGPHRPAGE